MTPNKKSNTENFLPHPEFNVEVSRRSLLKTMGVFAAASVVPELVRPVTTKMGEIYDDLVSLETVLTPKAMIPLEPRETDIPIVEPNRHGESVAVQSRYARSDETVTLHFDDDISLQAEHTNTPIGDTQFTAAGTAIITTAEGLQDGEQEYCQLFSGENTTVAVGYSSGGIYVFEPGLSGKETQGEWVRVVTVPEEDGVTSHVIGSASWETLMSSKPDALLIEEVTQGSETLRALGYRPFDAILPSTHTPYERESIYTSDNCAQTPQEVIDRTKPYFITNDGIVVDANHLEAKAGETLNLFAQLLYQQVSSETHPTAIVRYSAGNDAAFNFTVEPDSLRSETIINTTFSIMNAASTLMEGVSQRYVVENVPLVESMVESSGMSHEDMFTNTLASVGMLSLIKEYGLADKLHQALELMHRRDPDISPEDISNMVTEELQPELVSRVMTQTIQRQGISTFDTPIRATLPRGFYPLIPVKVGLGTDTQAPNITSLLRASNIEVNDPNVHFTPTHVPAMQPTTGKALSKAGL